MPITGGGVSTLDGLSDVIIAAPANSHVLHYNGTEWHNLNSATDWLSQYLYLPGRTSGQVLGANAHANGTLYDFCTEGRLMIDSIGTNAFGNGIALGIFSDAATNSSVINQNVRLTNLTGVASGTINFLSCSTLGNPVYTSGSYTINGLNFSVPVLGNPSGVTVFVTAGRFQIGFGTNSGTLGLVRGALYQINGSATVGQATCPEMVGIEVIQSSSRTPTTVARGIKLSSSVGVFTAVTATYAAIEILSNLYHNANVTDWSGLKMPNITAPTGQKWGLDLYGDVLKHRIGGPTAVGWVPALNASVTSQCHLAAGTATAATSPLKMPPGTNLTIPEVGAVENDGFDFFVTDGTGDRNRLAPRLLSRTVGIDTTVVAANLIYTVPAGRKLVVVDVIIRTTAYNAGNFTCNVKGAAVGDIVAGFVTTFAAVNQGIKPVIVTPFTIQAAGQAIHLDITATTTVAATTVAVDLIGYLI